MSARFSCRFVCRRAENGSGEGCLRQRWRRQVEARFAVCLCRRARSVSQRLDSSRDSPHRLYALYVVEPAAGVNGDEIPLRQQKLSANRQAVPLRTFEACIAPTSSSVRYRGTRCSRILKDPPTDLSFISLLPVQLDLAIMVRSHRLSEVLVLPGSGGRTVS